MGYGYTDLSNSGGSAGYSGGNYGLSDAQINSLLSMPNDQFSSWLTNSGGNYGINVGNSEASNPSFLSNNSISGSNSASGGNSPWGAIGQTLGGILSNPYAIPALASGIGSLVGSNAAKSAAQTQANAGQAATAAQQQMFDTINAQQGPYRAAGYTSLADLSGRLGLTPTGSPTDGSLAHNFNASDLNSNLAPNYEWQLGQGLGAVQNSAAVNGGLVGGNTLKAINDYAQNFAGNAYQNAFSNYTTNQNNIYNRLSNIAGLGQVAGSAGTTGAPSFASGISNTLTGTGAALAGGTIGSANAITSGLNNAGAYYALPQILSASQPSK